MHAVKSELDKNNVCFGCLSSIRQLKPLKTHLDDLFYILLGHQRVYNAKILLCWECKALLEKTHMFQKRIQQAQFVLQESICSMDAMQDLSTLSITMNHTYDHIIQYDQNEKQYTNDFNNPEIPELDNLLESNVYNENSVVKDEIDDVLYNDMKIENDYPMDSDELPDSKNDNYETLPMIKNNNIKNNDIEEDYVPSVPKKKSVNKNYFDAYKDKVTITDADLDLDNLRMYWCRVTLNEREIEELLEKDFSERPGIRKDKPFQCNNCKNAYTREVDYKRHITFNHNPTGKHCKQCKKSCKTFVILEKHWAEYHNHYFRCKICDFIANKSTTVVYHIEAEHSKKYICNECNDQTSTMKEFRRHYKSKHERLICDDCGKTFVKKRSFETHYKRHHMPPTCEVCNKTYPHYQNLDNHYRLNHPEFINCENRRELAYCVECNKQFPSVYKYRRHLASAAVHTPPKVEVVPCPECGKVFSRKIRMTNHVMSVHKKNTKHRCDICNKTFCSAYSARTHRQCVHEKVPMPKNKFCDICGRGFSTNRILSNHRRTHTGERPYACPHCPATFAQRIAMKTHARTQHKNFVHADQGADSGGITK